MADAKKRTAHLRSHGLFPAGLSSVLEKHFHF